MDLDMFMLDSCFFHFIWCNKNFILDWVMVHAQPVIILYDDIPCLLWFNLEPTQIPFVLKVFIFKPENYFILIVFM